LLTFHIVAGTVVLLSGIGALVLPKGKKAHRGSGNLFFFSLLLMAGSGAVLADEPTIAFTSIYFAATAWVITKRPENKTGIFELIALIVISIICARYFFVAFTSEAGFMVTMFYIFGSVALIAALLDLNMIIRGGLSGTHRVARHLWRMCYALLGAVLSFVANTSDKWSAFIPEDLPIYLIIIIMFYWLFIVLFTPWFDKYENIIGKGSSVINVMKNKV
jgi:hypothetical protein